MIKTINIIITILVLSVSTAVCESSSSSPAIKSNQVINWNQTPAATVIKNGEHVLVTKVGTMYVAEDAKFKFESFIWLHKVRYPQEMENLLIPVDQVHILYVQGFTKE